MIMITSLEMRMAELMAQQAVASALMDAAAERVRGELQEEAERARADNHLTLCLCTRQGLYT